MKRPIHTGIACALGLSLALALLWLLGSGLPTARAAGPWYISTTGDDGNDCLSWAKACRNIQTAIISATAGDTLYIAAGTYTENLSINKSLTFIGAGADSTIVDGNKAGRVFNITSGDVSISDLTVQNGSVTNADGGGIYAGGNLTLTDVTVISNTASREGGGVYVSGNASFSSGRLENNRSTSGYGGGANVNGSLIMIDTLVLSNTAYHSCGGAAVYQNAALSGGRFENNLAADGGAGGMGVMGDLIMTDTSFIHNISSGGGAAYVYGNVAASGGLFENNWSMLSGANPGYGGGLLAGSVTLTGTRFISNVGVYGGGAYVYGNGRNSRIVNVLFDLNWTRRQGAALYLFDPTRFLGGSADILHTTVAGATFLSSRAAICVLSSTLRITNTIVASHTFGISSTGGTVYEDYNLFFGNTTNLTGTIVSGGHSITGNPAFLDPEGDDYHLTAASYAIDAGVDSGIATDFEGDSRPQGNGYDIGYDESPFTAQADLSVSEAASPSSVGTGRLLTYTLTFTNAGPNLTPSVTVTDALPPGVTSVSAPGCVVAAGVITCTVTRLEVNAPTSLTITVNAPPEPGVITNIAGITGTVIDTDMLNNTAWVTTTIIPIADLSISKTASPDSVGAGQLLTFTLTFTNAGPNEATNVVITDALPPGVTAVNAPGCAVAGSVITCTVASLGVNVPTSLTITVNAPPDPGVITNTAGITATVIDTETLNNTSWVTTTVTPVADLSINKADSPDPVNAGEAITFTVVVTNNGPNLALNVWLTDRVPTSTTFQSIACPTGWSCVTPPIGGTGDITATNPSLSVDVPVILTIVVRLDSRVLDGTLITNEATVSSDAPDPTSPSVATTATTVKWHSICLPIVMRQVR